MYTIHEEADLIVIAPWRSSSLRRSAVRSQKCLVELIVFNKDVTKTETIGVQEENWGQ